MGCASRAVQTEAIHQDYTGSKDFEVPGVPFVNQKEGYCGPASLTMVLRWAGKSADVEQVASQMYTPGMKGSLQSDMIGASRRQGMMAMPIQGMENLLREVNAGHPVIIFENLGLTWLPQWHYAVVYGYDLNQNKVIMHSGPEQGKRWALDRFERSWMLADYWGLLVLPSDRLSVTADELAHVTAAAGLEQVGHSQEAGQAYQTILEKWPNSLGASIGLGNIMFAREDFKESAEILRKASRQHPADATVWHNLAIVEAKLKNKSQAKASAMQAMKNASEDQKKNFRENLKELL